MKIWLNGEIVELEDAKISSLSHTLHYGTGVFEGVRSYNTENGVLIFRLEDHVTRLFNSAKILGIDISYSKQEIVQACVEVIRRNGLKDAYIRPLVMFGYGGMGLDVESIRPNPVQIVITAWEWASYFDPEMKGLRVLISEWQRVFPHGKAVQAKAVGNYLNSYLAYNDAKKKGYDEAVLVDSRGYLAEASASNLFVVKDEVLYTPHIQYALDGVTRNTVMCLASDLGIPMSEMDMPKSWLLKADEAFVTGTACELEPISSVNGIILKGGDMTPVLAAYYRKIVRNSYEFGDDQQQKIANWYEPVETDPGNLYSALSN